MNAHFGEIVDFNIHDGVGQTEFGDTIFQHAANLVKRLEYIHVVALLDHVAGKAQSRRTRAHYGNLDAVRGSNLGDRHVATLALEVGGKALQIADGNGLTATLQMNTLALALLLLRTNTAADGGQGRGVFQHLGSCQELTALDILDERGDVHVYGATLHARRLGAVKTALCLGESLLLGETCVHLFCAGCGTIDGVELWHLHALDGHTLLGLHALA